MPAARRVGVAYVEPHWIRSTVDPKSGRIVECYLFKALLTLPWVVGAPGT